MIGLLLSLASPSHNAWGAAEARQSGSGVLGRAQHLTTAGHWEAAVAICDSAIASLVGSDPESQAERELLGVHRRTLRDAASLQPDELRLLAAADSLWLVFGVQFRADSIPEAAATVDQELALRRRILPPDHWWNASAYANRGLCEKLLGHFESAERWYRKALSIRSAHLSRSHPQVASVAEKLGLLLVRSKRSVDGVLLISDAAESYATVYGRRSEKYARALHNLGYAYSCMGRYTEARQHLRRALRIFEEIGGKEHPDRAQVLDALARAIPPSDAAAADDTMAQALDLMRLRATLDAPLLARMQVHACIDSCMHGGSCTTPALEALSVFRRHFGPNSRDELVTRLTLAGRYLYHSQLESCDVHLRQVQAIALLSGDVADADALYAAITQARLHLARGEIDNARLTADSALERIRRLMPNDLQLMSQALWTRSLVSEAEGDIEATANLLEQYLMHQNDRPDAAHGALFEADRTNGAANARLSAALLRRGSPSEAWIAADSGRDRLLRHFRTQPLHGHGMLSRERLARVRAALREEEAVVGWVVAESNAIGVLPSSWAYVLRKQGEIAWVPLPTLQGERPPAVINLRPRYESQAHRFVCEVLGRDCKEAESATDWREFSSATLGSVVNLLEGVTRVILIPSGAQAGLPLDALWVAPETHLLDRFEACFAPSALAFACARLANDTRPPRPESNVLIVSPGSKTSRHQQPSLSFPTPGPLSAITANRGVGVDYGALVTSEIGTLRKLRPNATVLGSASCPLDSLRDLAAGQRLREYDVIHIASHAAAAPSSAGKAALCFFCSPSDSCTDSPGEADPPGAHLPAAEIAKVWNLDARLVTLAACETGVGAYIPGEGYLGLTEATLAAGASCVLASLWKVDSDATSLLMSRFYEHLYDPGVGRADGHGKTPARALAEAKRDLRDLKDRDGNHPYEAPYYWAGFVLVGDGHSTLSR